MAVAKAGPRKTARTVTLKLTEGEADFLLGLIGMVGGHPSKSPAKYGRRIMSALEATLGYGVIDTDMDHLSIGSVTTFDYDNHPEIEPSERAIAHLTAHGTQLSAQFYPERASVESLIGKIAEFFEWAERNGVFE